MSKPIKTEIVTIDRIYWTSGDLIEKIKQIRDNEKLDLLKIAILASPKSGDYETIPIGEGKIELRIDPMNLQIPRKVHEISDTYTIDELIYDLETLNDRLVHEYDAYDLRLYADYLLILDKGDSSNNAYVIAEFRKMDEIKNTSEIGIQIYPEEKPLDIVALYRVIFDKKKESWKPDKKNYIKKYSENKHYVEARDVLRYTRNLFIDDICGIRTCQVKKVLTTDWNYEPFPEGSCKIGDKKKYLTNQLEQED